PAAMATSTASKMMRASEPGGGVGGTWPRGRGASKPLGLSTKPTEIVYSLDGGRRYRGAPSEEQRGDSSAGVRGRPWMRNSIRPTREPARPAARTARTYTTLRSPAVDLLGTGRNANRCWAALSAGASGLGLSIGVVARARSTLEDHAAGHTQRRVGSWL